MSRKLLLALGAVALMSTPALAKPAIGQGRPHRCGPHHGLVPGAVLVSSVAALLAELQRAG